MRNKSTPIASNLIGSLAAGVLLVGCSYQHGEDFSSTSNPTRVNQFVSAQAAAGAKSDATLYDHNFDGSNLNSLGKNKLDLICQASKPNDSIAVYLDMPHDVVADREAAVSAYLKKTGVKDTQIKLAEGPNPGVTTPAAYNLPTVYKSDGVSYNGLAADADTGQSGGAAPSK